MRRLRIGLVQLTATEDREANLEAAEGVVQRAASSGAQWVTLPENFAYMRREGDVVEAAEDRSGSIVTSVQSWARNHGIWILGGSFAERIEGSDQVYNTSFLVDPEGQIAAWYRKIHLFDVDLGKSGGGRFLESRYYRPGTEPTAADMPWGRVGLSICYDLRFPELYRHYADAGARFLCVPSAFAPATGKDHWEPLLRARAIENQAFVIAPAQSGRHSESRESYGRSMLIDPWGTVLATLPDGPGLALVDCDLERLEDTRTAIPALQHRRLGRDLAPSD